MPYPEEPSNSIEETVAQRKAETRQIIDSLKLQLTQAGNATRDASGRAALTVLSWIDDRFEGGISGAVAFTDQTELIAQSIRFDAHVLGESASPKIASLRKGAHQIRDRYAKHVAEREAISPTWNWSVPSEEPRGFGQALKVMLDGVVSSDSRLAKEVERFNQTHESTFAGEVFARSIRATDNAAHGNPVDANDFVSLLLLPGALSDRVWKGLPKIVRAAISAAPAGVAIACGGAVTTEPAAQPTTQAVVQEVATAQATGAPETAAPATSGVEAAATATLAPQVEASPTAVLSGAQEATGGSLDVEQANLVDIDFNFLVQKGALASNATVLGVVDNGRIYFVDGDPYNRILDNSYGNGTPTLITRDDSLATGFFTFSTGEFNSSLASFGINEEVVSIRYDAAGYFIGFNQDAEIVGKRLTFTKVDGSQVAVLLPTGAVTSADGYIWNDLFYRFNPDSGDFTPEALPEFGTQRENPDSKQLEYWDGVQWRLPERFEPEPGTFIDVIPTGETVTITPEDQIASSLESYNAFSIPGLGAINESASTQLETEHLSIFTHDQKTYTDASLFFKNTFLPVEAKRENWLLHYENNSVEMPAIRLMVAYKHADGRVLKGTLVFSYMVQDGYGNVTDNFVSLMRQLQDKPKTLGVFIVTNNYGARRNEIPPIGQHHFPYNESDVNEVLTAVEEGNFIFGDPLKGNNIQPALVDMVN